MSFFQKFNIIYHCFVDRYYFGTVNNHGVKSSNGTKMLRISCSKDLKKSMGVCDAAIEAKGLQDSF